MKYFGGLRSLPLNLIIHEKAFCFDRFDCFLKEWETWLQHINNSIDSSSGIIFPFSPTNHYVLYRFVRTFIPGCSTNQKSSAELKKFLESRNLPFLPTPMGKGLLPDDHPLCIAPARSLYVHIEYFRVPWVFYSPISCIIPFRVFSLAEISFTVHPRV